jgi:hypothetical protein
MLCDNQVAHVLSSMLIKMHIFDKYTNIIGTTKHSTEVFSHRYVNILEISFGKKSMDSEIS